MQHRWWGTLRDRYCEVARAYHTMLHIATMLERTEEWTRREMLRRPDCVGWAKAKDGQACELQPHLKMSCPSSCGVCGYVHVRKPPGKEEL